MVAIKDLRSITPRTNGTRKESNIKHLARHHSGTTVGDWSTFWPHWNKTKGWGTGGYHEIILRDGTVQICYDPNEITNGVHGHNDTTYHICVVGNGSFTEAQERAWEERCLLNLKRFNLSVDDVKGHKEFSGASTACPGIDMNKVRSRLQSLLSVQNVKSELRGIGKVLINTDGLSLRDGAGLEHKLIREMKKGDTYFAYDKEGMWYNLGADQWASEGAGKNHLTFTPHPKPVVVNPIVKPVVTPVAKDKLFKVQVGAFGEKENAERLAKELQGKGYPVLIVEV